MPLYTPVPLNQYRLVTDMGHTRHDAVTSGTYVYSANNSFTATQAGAGQGVFYFDPADYAISGRTTYCRVIASLMTNDVAPAMNFTFGLYPVSAVAGAAATTSVTLGTVTAGSTIAFTTQAADTRGQGNSGDFAAPSAGFFALGAVLSGNMAASSSAAVRVALQVRAL